MELKDYRIKSMQPVPDVPLVPYSGGIITKSTYASRPTAVLLYNLPFVYNGFKILCLMTVMKHEGVSFTSVANVSSEHEYYEHFKGFLTNYEFREIRQDEKRASIVELTIVITETEVRKAPKFRAIPA